MMTLVIFFTVTGCASGKMGNSTIEEKDVLIANQALVNFTGIDDLIKNSDLIMLARVESCKYMNLQNDYYEYKVEPIKVYKGKESTDTVREYLYSYSSETNIEKNGFTGKKFEVDKEYIFILQHMYNVFNDEYTVLGDAVISVDDSEALIYNEEYDICEIEKKINYLRTEYPTGAGDSLSIPYTSADDKTEIMEFAKYIADVKVLYYDDTTDYADLYYCEVISQDKGKMTMTDDSLIYTVAAHNAILEVR